MFLWFSKSSGSLSSSLVLCFSSFPDYVHLVLKLESLGLNIDTLKIGPCVARGSPRRPDNNYASLFACYRKAEEL